MGTILLGILIVNTLVLGDGNSLQAAAEQIVEQGIDSIGGLRLGGE